MVDDIENIIKFSGNDLQFRTKELLVDEGWSCDVSPHYNDSATGISREIDIIASKGFGDFNFLFFIECKFINFPYVFWLDKKNIIEATRLAKGNSVFREEHDVVLKDTSTLPHKIHHYIQDNPVVKSWDNDSKKGKDLFFDGLNQSLNALIFSREYNYNDSTIYSPLIVVDSFKNLHKRDSSPKGYSPIEDNFQIENRHSFIVNNPTGGKVDKSDYFLIDVVSFDKLKDFLKSLEDNDIPLMKIMSYHHKIQSEMKARQLRKPKENQYR